MSISNTEVKAIREAFYNRTTKLSQENVKAVFDLLYKQNPDITRRELAEYFDVYETTIVHWLKGTRTPAGENKWVFKIILFANNLIK